MSGSPLSFGSLLTLVISPSSSSSSMWRVKVLSLTTRFPVTVATATPGRISTGVRDFARALDISRCSKQMFKMSNLMQKWIVNISLVVWFIFHTSLNLLKIFLPTSKNICIIFIHSVNRKLSDNYNV